MKENNFWVLCDDKNYIGASYLYGIDTVDGKPMFCTDIVTAYKYKTKEEAEQANIKYNLSCYPLSIDEINKNKEMVNHPSHYNKGGIECIDAIKASMTDEAFKGFLKGNVMKYMYRYESKEKPLEDLKKAEWYLQRLIKEFGPSK